MTQVTSQEIAQFRSQLAENNTAMEVLDLIEDCEGDLGDAAMTLAIKIGQQPDITNCEWLDALARKWRAVICQSEYRDDLRDGSVSGIIGHLESISEFPNILILPVLMYILKQGVNNFCEPLDGIK